MTAAELTDWRAFERVAGPLSIHERIDAAAAHIAWVLVSMFSPPDRDVPPVEEFLPHWGRSPAPVSSAPQSADQMIAKVRSIQSRQPKKKGG